MIDIPVDGLIVGLEFDNEDIAVNSIMAWSRKVFCPLVKSRRSPGLTEINGGKRGRIYFENVLKKWKDSAF